MTSDADQPRQHVASRAFRSLLREKLTQARFHGDTLVAMDYCEVLWRDARESAPELAAHYRRAYDALMEARYLLESERGDT